MLKRYRDRAKVKPYEAAVEIGVSPMTIDRWEKGSTEPVISQFSKLCELYGITDSEIVSIVRGYGVHKEAMSPWHPKVKD